MKLEAAQIANGANELLGEVSASKITGEEERYSHTDLVDFEANVDGSKVAFESVRPILEHPPRSKSGTLGLEATDPILAKEIARPLRRRLPHARPLRPRRRLRPL